MRKNQSKQTGNLHTGANQQLLTFRGDMQVQGKEKRTIGEIDAVPHNTNVVNKMSKNSSPK
jgi:hypothetical protein